MPIDIAVVPVAGHGTRLLPATKSQPKEMLPVGRKPVAGQLAHFQSDKRGVFVTLAAQAGADFGQQLRAFFVGGRGPKCLCAADSVKHGG